MELELEELQKYLKKIDSFSLPSYKELPSVDLYMEQVLKYVNSTLEELSPEQEKVLTSFMVNNYVKAKIIDFPVKKKYTKDQIGYLMAICLLKTTVSMSDIGLLFELDQNVSNEKNRLYEFWSSMEASILREAAKKTSLKVEGLAKKYNSAKDKKKADEDLRDGLALVALRLAMQAQANKLLSDAIIYEIRKDMHGAVVEEEDTLSKREVHHDARKGKHTAKRLADAKEKQAKINRKNEKKARKKAAELDLDDGK